MKAKKSHSTKLKVLLALVVLVGAGFVALGFMTPKITSQPVEKSLTLDQLKSAS